LVQEQLKRDPHIGVIAESVLQRTLSWKYP
jgi:hypothetical protein